MKSPRRSPFQVLPPALLAAAVLAAAPHAGASTRYVDAALASGANDGSSWANAHQGADGLQAALALAVAGDQIWVSQGTYKPTLTTNRNIYFDLKTGVAIYGGFTGVETLLAERDPAANVTILSGDLAGDDPLSVAENSIHVVRGNGASATAVLDGFTVRGGNANGAAAGSNDRGGGFLMLAGSNATIARCIVKENRCTFGGGAGYITQSSPTFTDTYFEDNFGGAFGGAFDMATGVSATFNRCVFRNNSAARAGAVEIFGGSPVKLYNCLLEGNTATGAGGGGAMFISNSAAVIRNCTVVDNVANSNVAGILHTGGTTSIANSIVAFNTGPGGQVAGEQITASAAMTVSYTCVQNGFAGTGNINADPVFVDFFGHDYHLVAGSPCIDAGNSSLSVVAGAFDLDLAPRVADDPLTADTGPGTAPRIDMGVYEAPNGLYTPFCFGDGTLATACPCNNIGDPGHGCASSGEFATLSAILHASGAANPDSVVLTASRMLPNASCIFLQGNALAANGIVFGDGLRCAAGQLVRLGTKQASGGIASYPELGDPSISDRSAALGDFISRGEVRYYQTYYRDPDPFHCPNPPGNTWNVTSGVIVQW